jgi:hypothetical protein
MHIPTACTWFKQLCCSYKAILNAVNGRRERSGATKCSLRTESVLPREQSTNRSCADCHQRYRHTRKYEASGSCPDTRNRLPVFTPQNTAESRHFPAPRNGSSKPFFFCNSHFKLIFQKLNLNLELGKAPCSSSKNWSPVQANFVVKIKRVPKRLSNMPQNSAWIMTGMSTLLDRDTTSGLLAWKHRRLESE